MSAESWAELFVEGLRVVCIVGDLPHERTEPQEIVIQIRARLDLSRVLLLDDLEDSVDYVALATEAMEIAQKGHFHLVEALVKAIADQSLARWPKLLQIWVRIEKQGCMPSAKCCGIEYLCSRERNKLQSP